MLPRVTQPLGLVSDILDDYVKSETRAAGSNLDCKGMSSSKERGWTYEEDQVANDTGKVQHCSPGGIDRPKVLLCNRGVEAFLPKSASKPFLRMPIHCMLYYHFLDRRIREHALLTLDLDCDS